MKINRSESPKTFVPITITIESQEELQTFISLVNVAALRASGNGVNSMAHILYGKLTPLLY